MEIKTKANIGDTIYFISDRKIVSDKIINITIEIYRHLETEIHYFISKEYTNSGIIDECDIAISVEDLIKKLLEDFNKENLTNTEANDDK